MTSFSPDLVHLALALLVGGLVVLLLLTRHRHRGQQQTLDNLPVGLCTVDADMQVGLWNREMEALSGLPASQATGRAVQSLPAPWAQALQEALDAGDEVIKRRLADDGGAPRWIVAHGSDKGPGQRSVLIEDISDYQMLQDELLHKERLASIGRLAAGVAHEIGNPVTGIACLAQNLGAFGDNEEVSQSAEEILKQSQRISRIVNSLLQFSHSGGTEQRVDIRPCNLADCIDEAIHLLRLDPEAPGALFDNRCHREELVAADTQLLLQVFINLLDNARTASPPGCPVVIDAASAGDRVQITVDNDGAVIPENIMGQVFEPFFTTKDVGEGTGLGLSLVRSMVEDMAGDISLLSPRPAPLSGGTRATLQLPRGRYGSGG
jgi:signal transduction histidine kinase